ncbi:MAG: pyridoxal 5'-phosphate synthase glutaminase subunit PdxT [Chloroflexota bacterium]|nr:pyridoxal 5'-phosphate synthase glutaminase subunit PdxT [Chloroflexota bacterium]MDE3103169.1 pyridoxal 5'-phosphate synthase glutaminase subunit PdxT [Chloroflexota bacterium]
MVKAKLRAGVLGLQGDFAEHLATLRDMGVAAVDVRRPEQLDQVDALIIPGGESTTIGKLAAQYGIISKVRERAAEGMPVWGTCAGAIFIAKNVPAHPHPLAALMDMTVERNVFGRQIDSFEADLDMPVIGPKPFHAIFIRAPRIARVGDGVDVLATLNDGTVVAARQGRLLATSFHPELTPDRRLHEYFLSLIGGAP